MFKIKTDVFEGPLELLLSLVEKRKLFINEISLAKIADDYIQHLEHHNAIPMEDSANFILVASTLVLIKSKSLLPNLSLTSEEQGNIEDLERRLKIYKIIKDRAIIVEKLYGSRPFYPPEGRKREPLFSPDISITVSNIAETLLHMIREIPKPEVLPKAVVQKVISLEHMIEDLTVRVSNSLRMSFREFAKVGKEQKVNVIVGFLALLELVKQGLIRVSQEHRTDDIMIETETLNVPRYE